MDKSIAIKVEDIHKSFKVPHESSSSLKSAVVNIFKKKTFSQYDAARGISFEVKKGEFLGIIGRNGCGKSTMLKMLAGIYLPDKGKIKLNGELSPFLELGVGFNPELSGRDNIYLNGAILGLTNREIDQKFDEILDFAELREFIDQKLKNYSSGMQVRLAFSVAIHAHAEILLIDEVLAVGDSNFQRKCAEKFQEFKNNGKTVVFVSHSMQYVERFCDRVLLFNEGKIAFNGSAEEAAEHYMQLQNSKFSSEDTLTTNGLIKCLFFSNQGRKKMMFRSNEEVTIELTFRTPIKIKDELNIGLGIYSLEKDYRVAGFNTFYDNVKMDKRIRNGKVSLRLSKDLFSAGEFYILTSVFKGDPKDEKYLDIYNSKLNNETFIIKPVNDVSAGAMFIKHEWK